MEEYLCFFGYLREKFLNEDLGEWEGTWVTGTIPYRTCKYAEGEVKYAIYDKSATHVVGEPTPEYKVLVQEKKSEMEDGHIYIDEIGLWVHNEYFTRI